MAARKLNAKIVVVHCLDFWFPDESYDEKYEIVKSRFDTLKELARTDKNIDYWQCICQTEFLNNAQRAACSFIEKQNSLI